jgi:hypothetical protein
MSVARSHLSILRTVGVYERLLDSVSEDVFTATPPMGGWSYAEVYTHIFTTNIVCIAAIDKCIQGKATESSTPLHFLVRMVFLFGRFPRGNKVPDRFKENVTKATRDEARALIVDFKDKLEAITPATPGASKTQRQKHPRMGMLDAVKWYEFIDIHTRHHKRQLDRISRSFARSRA